MPRRPGAISPLYDACALPVVHLDAEHPRAVVTRRIRSGDWVPLRKGAYVDRATLSAEPYTAERQVALARIVAVGRQLRTHYAVSHASAAMLWDLPLLTVPEVTHVIQSTRRAGTAAPDLVRHLRAAEAIGAVQRRGQPVTPLDRTLLDCALTLGPREGLVVADAAAAAGADLGVCRRMLAAEPGVRGAVVGRAVLELADPGAESPGETLARWVVLRAGLPVPRTQVEIETHLGTFWADLGWPEWRVVIEYDGRAKYTAGGSAAKVVLSEKRRQDAIVEAGWQVLRLTGEDLRHPDLTIRRILRALPPGVVARLGPRRALCG